MARASESTANHGPDGAPAVSPYLVADDAHGLVTFLEGAFGALVLRSDTDAEGRLRHAALRVAGCVVMVGTASAEWPAMRAMLHVYLPDVDRAHAQARQAGGTSLQEPEDRSYGDRIGAVVDPAGNQWWIATRLEPTGRPEELPEPGDRTGGRSGVVRASVPRVREAFPHLCIAGASRAIAFYGDVFGARERLRMNGPGGIVAHAELDFGPFKVMVSDEYPELGIHAPPTWGGTPVRLHLHVDDVDGLAEAATAAGAAVLRGPRDEDHGERQCLLRDPFGHEWLLGDGASAH